MVIKAAVRERNGSDDARELEAVFGIGSLWPPDSYVLVGGGVHLAELLVGGGWVGKLPVGCEMVDDRG